MKRLLLLSTTTGYQAGAFLCAAQELGLSVTLGTDRCHILPDPWSDGAVALRFDDPEGNAAALSNVQFDAVAAIGDGPAVTAAVVCESRGIPFHTPQGARAARDKLLSRTLLAEGGLQVPRFAEAARDGFATPQTHATPQRGPSFPCVLKPAAMSASRGVIRANNAEEYRAAYDKIVALGPGRILIEDFIPGLEFAIEGIVHCGQLQVLAIFDKPDPLDGPYFEETIYVTPSRLSARDQASLIATVADACRALGLSHGPIHAEARWNEHGAWILEVAARPIGGLCSRALRFNDKATLENAILRHALGESIADVKREEAPSGVMMIPVPSGGVYLDVEGLDEARAIPGVTNIEITAKSGQMLEAWPEGSSYLGFIFGRGEGPLRLAHQALRFQIAKSLPMLK